MIRWAPPDEALQWSARCLAHSTGITSSLTTPHIALELTDGKSRKSGEDPPLRGTQLSRARCEHLLARANAKGAARKSAGRRSPSRMPPRP